MTDIETVIREVTVYADRALVTRRGSIHLEAGEHEVRVNNLPQFVRESLRAAGRGPQGTQILNVEITTAYHGRYTETEIAQLEVDLEQLVQQQKMLQARQDALNDRRQWLRSLGEQSRDFAKGLAQGQMKPQDCAEFFRFAAEQAAQDAEAAQALEVQLKRIHQDIQAKQREIYDKQGHTTTDRLATTVNVAMAVEGDLELEISYLVREASWYPQYDVRVQMEGEKSAGEVELTYIGTVQQATGEAWENVELALSTARPSLTAVLPELDPWYLNVSVPPPPRPLAPRMAAPMAYGKMAESASDLADGAMAMASFAQSMAPGGAPAPALEVPQEVEVATTTVEHSGTALVFRAGRSVDIPSDNSPHKTTIARDRLPCEFDYVTAPAIEQYAHLRAEITNTTERVLLQGEANIFLSGDYVGTTQIKTTAPTEKFKIFLGIDDAIKIKREPIERAVDKGNLLQSDLRRSTYAYLITIHNYAPGPRKVVLRDHLPVSQHERIKVKLLNVQPQPLERTKLELLKWEFTLPPDGEQKVEYRFVVEHPQNLRVAGLPQV